MKAVILAGGKGTRLKPYTTNFPKPLMPVGEKPILEIVLRDLRNTGITDIIITTGHLSEMIRLFFGDGRKFGLNITYSIEDKPMGTAGPIKLIKDQLNDHFLIMNGDVLTNLDYRDLINFHLSNNNIATIGTTARSQFVDFGLVELDKNHHFSAWTEKPSLQYLVSMGIYVFSSKILKYIPEGTFFNMPDLIQILNENNQKIMGYVHNGYWLDIGRPEDYEQACNDFKDTSNVFK